MTCTTPGCVRTAVDQFIGLCASCDAAELDGFVPDVAKEPDTRPYVRTVFIDYETRLFSPGNLAPPPIVLAWATDNNFGLNRAKVGMVVGHDAMRRHIADLLTRALRGEFVLAAFHAAFDMAVSIQAWPELIPLVFSCYAAGQIADPRVIEKLLDIAKGTHGAQGRKYDLEELLERRLGIIVEGKATWNKKGELLDPGIQLDFERFEGVPLAQWPTTHKQYVMNDCKHGLALMRNQEDRAREIQYSLPDAANHVRADFGLYLTTCRGQTPDQEAVEALDARLDAHQAELIPILQAAGLINVKAKGKYAGEITKSVKAMRQLVYEAFKGNPPMAESGKNVATDSDTLEDAGLLLNGANPGFDAWMTYAGNEKVRSTYLSHWRDPVAHANYNCLVETGRTSSFKFNVQNLPRAEGARECFKARPGFVLAASDLDSIEMRSWSEACFEITGRSTLGDRYIADSRFDPHLAGGAVLLGISEEEALVRKENKDSEVIEARQQFKICNFGLAGGMGVAGLVRFARGYDQRWLDAENCAGCADLDSWKNTGKYVPHVCKTQQLKDAWIRQWHPKDYFNFIKSLDGTLIQLYSNRRRGGIGFTSGANSVFQGLTADAAKEALFVAVRCMFDWTMGSPLFGCRPWAFIHDEVVVEAPEDYAAEAAEALRRVMIDTAQHWMPRIPIEAGVTLSRVWSKKTQTVRDAGGRLVPWEREVCRAA